MSVLDTVMNSSNHRHAVGEAIQVGRIRATPVMETLWRVCNASGTVLGHVHAVERTDGERFAAQLILPGGVRTLFLGEFWRLRDAIETFQ